MAWYKVINGEMVSGPTLEGPGFSRGNSAGPDVDGWKWFGNATAAYAALGVNPKVSGPDRGVLDTAIATVISVNIQNVLIAIRDNSPDGPPPEASVILKAGA